MRSASPRCGNATTTRWPARTNDASSCSASASPRAATAGRCASNAMRLPPRERIEQRRAGEVDRIEPLVRPHPAHLFRLEDEVGGAVERGLEVVRHRR